MTCSSSRPQAQWKGSLQGAAPKLGALSSSGASQMVTGASETDSPNPALAWRLLLTFARSLALFGEAVPTVHWGHSQEALSLLLLWEPEEPFAELSVVAAHGGRHTQAVRPHTVCSGHKPLPRKKPRSRVFCGTKQPVSSMPPGFTDM